MGKRFRIAVAGVNVDQPWVEVVGVVGHLRHEGLDRDPRPQVYWPYAQRTQDRVAMTVRTGTEPAALVRSVRAAIREVDPDQPIYDVRPMREVVDRTLAGNRLNLVLMAAFAVMALLLASVGLYAVVAQLTTRRRREFGIRMALGATERQVMGLVLGQGVRLGAAGLALGLALAVAATRILTTMLHGVRPLDPLSYAAAGWPAGGGGPGRHLAARPPSHEAAPRRGAPSRLNARCPPGAQAMRVRPIEIR